MNIPIIRWIIAIIYFCIQLVASIMQNYFYSCYESVMQLGDRLQYKMKLFCLINNFYLNLEIKSISLAANKI